MRGFAFAVRPRAFCIMSRLVIVCSKVKAVRGRSRSESESEQGVEWHEVDPKPRELPMARVKVR